MHRETMAQTCGNQRAETQGNRGVADEHRCPPRFLCAPSVSALNLSERGKASRERVG
jgi:hypothetical protein